MRTCESGAVAGGTSGGFAGGVVSLFGFHVAGGVGTAGGHVAKGGGAFGEPGDVRRRHGERVICSVAGTSGDDSDITSDARSGDLSEQEHTDERQEFRARGKDKGGRGSRCTVKDTVAPVPSADVVA